MGEKKFYNLPSSTYLNVWMDKSETNDELALPLSNAITVSSNPRLKKSCTNMKGFLFAGNNDFQNAPTGTLISSSIYTGRNGGGVYITDGNLWQAAVVFAVRLLVRHTWINHNDQFLQPTAPLTDEFKTDCLIWMLFNRCNRTASVRRPRSARWPNGGPRNAKAPGVTAPEAKKIVRREGSTKRPNTAPNRPRKSRGLPE